MVYFSVQSRPSSSIGSQHRTSERPGFLSPNHTPRSLAAEVNNKYAVPSTNSFTPVLPSQPSIYPSGFIPYSPTTPMQGDIVSEDWIGYPEPKSPTTPIPIFEDGPLSEVWLGYPEPKSPATIEAEKKYGGHPSTWPQPIVSVEWVGHTKTRPGGFQIYAPTTPTFSNITPLVHSDRQIGRDTPVAGPSRLPAEHYAQGGSTPGRRQAPLPAPAKGILKKTPVRVSETDFSPTVTHKNTQLNANKANGAPLPIPPPSFSPYHN